MEEYQTLVRVVGLFTAVDLGVPTPVISAALFERFNSSRLGEFGNKILNGMRYMFGGHHVKRICHKCGGKMSTLQ